jgi:hypothetical protein
MAGNAEGHISLSLAVVKRIARILQKWWRRRDYSSTKFMISSLLFEVFLI